MLSTHTLGSLAVSKGRSGGSRSKRRSSDIDFTFTQPNGSVDWGNVIEATVAIVIMVVVLAFIGYVLWQIFRPAKKRTVTARKNVTLPPAPKVDLTKRSPVRSSGLSKSRSSWDLDDDPVYDDGYSDSSE